VPTAKTWVWVLLTIFGICVLALVATAGAGLYFVSHHIATTKATSSDAFRTFDTARSRFQTAPPLIEVDPLERAHEVRAISALPTSSVKPASICVLAWNPEDGRLARVTLPFWLLRFGKRRLDFIDEFDLDRLNLDVGELERIGPALILDYRTPTGERVLVWTQ
jgi:hypothetical protein